MVVMKDSKVTRDSGEAIPGYMAFAASTITQRPEGFFWLDAGSDEVTGPVECPVQRRNAEDGAQ